MVWMMPFDFVAEARRPDRDCREVERRSAATRSMPTRVNTDSCTANSPGVPAPNRPPISEYSPSLFSRTTSMSMASTPRSGLVDARAAASPGAG